MAGITSYVFNLPIPLKKQEAFDIAYSLVEHVNDYEYVVQPETIPSFVLDTKEVTKNILQQDFS